MLVSGQAGPLQGPVALGQAIAAASRDPPGPRRQPAPCTASPAAAAHRDRHTDSQVWVARQCDAWKFVPPHITNAVKRARPDLTKVGEMRRAARSEQSIEELSDRLYASDAGLDRDFH